jgi:hypothetical protein
LSWWWLPLGQKSMIPPCLDTPSEIFGKKIAGVNMYGFSEKQSFPVTVVQAIHWINGTNNCFSGTMINWL